ncbi:MAG: ABC transporter permease [Chloroflexota bacterium]|nr:ABC transporter permease [Chloroflexota bacterium]
MGAVALRNLGARKARTFLTSLAIVLGVMMVAGTYILTDTIDRSFEQIFTESTAELDAVITAEEVVETQDATLPPFDDGVLSRVLETDGVDTAEGGIADPQGAVIGSDGEPRGGNGAPTFGFSATEDERFDPLEYPEGGPPETDGQVVLDKATVEDEGFALGDRVEVAGKEAVKSYELVGIATLGDVDSFGGATLALFTLPEAQRITGKEGSSTPSTWPPKRVRPPTSWRATWGRSCPAPSRSRRATRTPTHSRRTSASSSASWRPRCSSSRGWPCSWPRS